MIKGLVKGVQSGDTIILSGKLPKNGGLPEEISLTLTGVYAPKIGNSSKLDEEAYSYDSREFLRKLVVGKVVLYKVDYSHNDRKFGHIVLDNKNINAEILKNGFAKIGFLPKGQEKLYQSELWTTLKEAEKEGKEKKLGIYAADSSDNKTHIRHLHNLSDAEEDKKKVDEAIDKNNEIDAIVEYVFNCAFLSVYIPKWNCFAKVNLRFISIPSNTKDPELYKKGKAYCERICLSKDVKLKIFDFDETKNLVCDVIVLDKNQNLAELILKEGYSKSFTGGNKNPKVYNLTDINLARAAESEAKSKRLGVWKDAVVTESKSLKKDVDDDLSDTRCIMVNSGDSLTVLNKKKEEVRIFLSNLKAPALAKFGTDEQNKPWAFQSRDFVRKKLVGKNIKCDLDYLHTVNQENTKGKGPQGSKSKRVMKFYTVYYTDDKGESQCINVEIIKNGLANIANYKIEEGNPSREFDAMLKAEQEAKKNKVGLFSPKVPPLCTYSDLITAGKTKKKEFINFLTGLEHLDCVVDFCFSANKFKLRIDQKQVMIPFGLIGVKSFTNDKNNSSLFEKYFKISHDFVVNTILQRDGKCDIIQADRIGNYFGNFIFDGKNFGTVLIEKGLAVCNERSSDLGKNKYINEMREAEKKAKEKKIGLWEDEGLAKLLKGDSFEETSSEKKFVQVNKDIKVRITDQIDFDKFYCNFLPNKTLDKIEEILADYDDEIRKPESLSLPIKIGTLCAAKFPDDNKYYRGLVKRFNKDKKEFQIEFIDYGNLETVKLNDLIKLDGEISSLPPQAMYCEMAYLQYSKMTMRKALDKYPNFVDFDNQLNAKYCYNYSQDAETKHGLIVFKDGKDMKKTYHADLLKIGYAKLNRNKELPDYMKPLDAIEKEAKDKELGVWDDNEEVDYDQNEDDM